MQLLLLKKDDADLTALYVVSSPTKEDDHTSDMPEDQIPETVKNIIHNAKKESQPWFNEITEKVSRAACDSKRGYKENC